MISPIKIKINNLHLLMINNIVKLKKLKIIINNKVQLLKFQMKIIKIYL